MNSQVWNEALNHIDPDLVEEYIEQKEKSEGQKRVFWLRCGTVAACLCAIITMIIVVSNLDAIMSSNRPITPIVNLQTPTSAPQYYGSASSVEASGGVQADLNSNGLSVTATLLETLPDTYTFFDDWHQYEYRLLRMRTVTLLKGTEMTEEFYYMVPVDFMTDFSLYDSFVIIDMAQFGYEYSVVYNKSQGKAERLELVLFGYRTYGYHLMGVNFMAFDADGKFDIGLWKSNEAWMKATQRSTSNGNTLRQAEENARQDSWGSDCRVHSLSGVTGEAANVLSQFLSFENGIYVPNTSSMMLYRSSKVDFIAVRYLNGFATNEYVSIRSKELTGGDEYSVAFSKAQFTQEDLMALPDLASALASVAAAYDEGLITPPHIKDYDESAIWSHGIFGWYAKTPDGVIGIIRVTWREFKTGKLDDAYYFVEYGSDAYTPIDRDALVERIGEYESTYIYLDGYGENGKTRLYPLY